MLRLQKDGTNAAHPGDGSWCVVLPHHTWGINRICFNAFTLEEKEPCFLGAMAAEIT